MKKKMYLKPEGIEGIFVEFEKAKFENGEFLISLSDHTKFENFLVLMERGYFTMVEFPGYINARGRVSDIFSVETISE